MAMVSPKTWDGGKGGGTRDWGGKSKVPVQARWKERVWQRTPWKPFADAQTEQKVEKTCHVYRL